MNVVFIFFIGSATLCFLLALFAEPLFWWGQRCNRHFGFHRLADFSERLWPALKPVVRIILSVCAMLLLFLTWRIM